MVIQICVIAKRVLEAKNDDSTFLFLSNNQLKIYKKLLKWKEFQKLLTLTKSCGFYTEETTINNSEYLVLYYSEEINTFKSNHQLLMQRKFVIENLFVRVNDNGEIIADKKEETSLTLEYFYEKIKQAHAKENFDSIPDDVQHPKLKQSTVLRPYQQKGIKWMLKRETVKDIAPSNFVRLHSKFKPLKVFYYNEITYTFLSKPPKRFYLPPGGMLCDEMGLGKSVEMITLMLMNPRNQGVKRKLENEAENIENKKVLIPNKDNPFKCLCNKDSKLVDAKKFIICTQCGTAQHIKCVFPRNITDEDRIDYVCPLCWKSSGRIVDAKTTIIICPTSIKKQWVGEIKRHVSDFKVLCYNGISNGFVSPDEIIKYDCVVTDFNTLSKELYFADIEYRELRQKKKFEYPVSPLLSVNWWRVILDEAQMVENQNNRPSQFAKLLPAQFRWCCTGTPIEKGRIGQLDGLIYFLDIKPYSLNVNFLINLLSKIMWRTCKKDVIHEILIPEQKEIIHCVQMSDLQKCFYEQAHRNTIPEFTKYVYNYLKRNSREKTDDGEIIIDYSLMDKQLRNDDTLKTFLEPLRKLRQDCTIANLFINVNDQTRVKQTLRVEQLHDHLSSKTALECKSALRTIISSLNGISALKIHQEKYEEAVELYKQVLRFSKDYTGVVSVDSMLQIHSYNGLIDIITITGKNIESQNEDYYLAEMGKLEWKYISNFYDKVKEINNQLKEQSEEIKKTSREYTDRKGIWWCEIISIQRTAEEDKRFFDLINSEIFSSVIMQSQLIDQVRSVHGIQLIITEWIDKFQRYTKDVMKHFASFDYLIEDLKPSYEQSDEINSKIAHLAQTAKICHLNLEDKDEEKTEQKNNKFLCDLCKLKRKLDEYECTLFNKTLVDDIGNVGTWNPRLEERLLKVIFHYAKRSDFDEEIVDMGNKFFKHLEALKTRYKILAQLYVEANYTISAYDELNMCKTRMQVVDSADEISEEDARFRFKIIRYQVEDQIETFQSQKQHAELQFTRLNGRMKYLEHLKEKNEIALCPICTLQPKERYFVTACGHTLCHQCFLILTKNKRGNFKINCPVCRTPQENNSIYAISCNDNQSSTSQIKITGSYSPKIDEMIRCILSLKKDEPEVKIIIFSHWDSILTAIMYGLKQNNITYRSSFKSNFNNQIEDFKDCNKNITCLMLNLKFGGKGLNLTEASHVFLVEPILKYDEEVQAVGRIHRIGQTKKTFVHRFITKNTIEDSIYDQIIQNKEKWIYNQFTPRDLENLLTLLESEEN